MTPSRAGDRVTAKARLDKARQFADTASLLFDSARGTADNPDAYVTSAVHAGIAAADVICIRGLGEYSASGAHDAAVGLLEKADKDLAKHLRRLLSLKTKAGYSASPVSASDVDVARRAYMALLEAAQAVM